VKQEASRLTWHLTDLFEKIPNWDCQKASLCFPQMLALASSLLPYWMCNMNQALDAQPWQHLK
jgi:hypothetical protein